MKLYVYVFDCVFYVKFVGVLFVIGVVFEVFMLKMDFYVKVVYIEVECRFFVE